MMNIISDTAVDLIAETLEISREISAPIANAKTMLQAKTITLVLMSSQSVTWSLSS